MKRLDNYQVEDTNHAQLQASKRGSIVSLKPGMVYLFIGDCILCLPEIMNGFTTTVKFPLRNIRSEWNISTPRDFMPKNGQISCWSLVRNFW